MITITSLRHPTTLQRIKTAMHIAQQTSSGACLGIQRTGKIIASYERQPLRSGFRFFYHTGNKKTEEITPIVLRALRENAH